MTYEHKFAISEGPCKGVEVCLPDGALHHNRIITVAEPLSFKALPIDADSSTDSFTVNVHEYRVVEHHRPNGTITFTLKYCKPPVRIFQ